MKKKISQKIKKSNKTKKNLKFQKTLKILRILKKIIFQKFLKKLKICQIWSSLVIMTKSMEILNMGIFQKISKKLVKKLLRIKRAQNLTFWSLGKIGLMSLLQRILSVLEIWSSWSVLWYWLNFMKKSWQRFLRAKRMDKEVIKNYNKFDKK